MEDLGVIDQFVATFSSYIDSGFGLLQPDVAFLTSALIAIDITLAGLFWAMGPDTDIIGRFLKKVLYVGAFALILGNFALLSDVVFTSFAQLGLNATGGTITADDIMKPGFVAATGFDAALPLLDEIEKLTGPLIESFNGRFRAECLNQHWFMSLADAREKLEAWRGDYNTVRPHSAIGNKPPITLMNHLGETSPLR